MKELHHIARPGGARLALFRQAPRRRSSKSVLVVHGATFPTSLSAGYRIDGTSWLDVLCESGFEAWGLDFQGFGASDRFPEVQDKAPGDATDAALQLSLAIDFIRSESPGASLSLVAHSWGTAPAGLVLSQMPGVVDRAVFYGPIVDRDCAQPSAQGSLPPFLEVDRDAQWSAFSAGVPEGTEPPIDSEEFARWMAAYLETDARRSSSSVRVPAGPVIDIARAGRGYLPYDPAAIETPVLVLRGSWDAVTTEADSIRFFHALRRSRGKRMTWLQDGTHRMHLERARFELFRAVGAFLSEKTERSARLPRCESPIATGSSSAPQPC